MPYQQVRAKGETKCRQGSDHQLSDEAGAAAQTADLQNNVNVCDPAQTLSSQSKRLQVGCET